MMIAARTAAPVVRQLATLALLLVASCEQVAPPDVSAAPARLTVIDAPPDAVIAGAPYGDSVRVLVEDEFDNPVVGATVTFTVSTGGGIVSPGAVPTNATGIAAARFVTGAIPGSNTLTITVGGVAPAAIEVLTIPIPVVEVRVAPFSVEPRIGRALQLTATTHDSLGRPLVDRPIAWSSSSTAVATVSGTGRVELVGAGPATIVASSEAASDTVELDVPPNPPVASVGVTIAATTLAVGDTAQATATPRDADGVPIAQSITWATTNAAVATVSASGVVTAVSSGSATIEATAAGVTGSLAITVVATAATINAPKFMIAVPSGTSTASLTVDGQTYVATGDGVVFSAAVPSVAQGAPYSWSVGGGAPSVFGNAMKVNYDAVRGPDDVPYTVTKSVSPGGMILSNASPAERLVMLDKAVEFGFDAVTIIPEWFVVPDVHGTEIRAIHAGDPLWANTSGWVAPTIDDDELRTLIRAAQARGLEVHLKPHIDDALFGMPGHTTGRGAAAPSDWAAWRASYTNFIVHYASIAEELNVPLFVVGTELDNQAIAELKDCCGGNPNADSDWRAIIAAVRGVYSGTLTYSISCAANCFGPSKITFFDAVDMIGFEPYMGLTTKTDPTIEEMTQGYRDQFDTWLKPIVDRFDKPVYLGEVNAYSFDGMNMDPINGSLVASRPLDHTEQANYYEAFFRALAERPYIRGYVLWGWYNGTLSPTAYEGGLTDGFDAFANKIAGQVVKKWQVP